MYLVAGLSLHFRPLRCFGRSCFAVPAFFSIPSLARTYWFIYSSCIFCCRCVAFSSLIQHLIFLFCLLIIIIIIIIIHSFQSFFKQALADDFFLEKQHAVSNILDSLSVSWSFFYNAVRADGLCLFSYFQVFQSLYKSFDIVLRASTAIDITITFLFHLFLFLFVYHSLGTYLSFPFLLFSLCCHLWLQSLQYGRIAVFNYYN